MIMIASKSPSPGAPGDVEALEEALALAFRLVTAVEAFAVEFADLGDIDLPPMLGSPVDQAHLQVVPPLYLAAQLEEAGLLPAVETLAGIFVSGGLGADIGPAAGLLATFWRGRHERFTARERQAFFARLFGAAAGPPLAVEGGRNTAFESLMIDLTETLYKLEPDPVLGGLPASQVPLRTAAGQLAANLIPRSGGMATYAARDILATCQAALAILKQPLLQSFLGGHGVWQAVRTINRQYLSIDADISPYVTRGQAGMHVLAWLAAVVPRLDTTTGALMSPTDPVIGAAAEWLQSSLTLHERDAPPNVGEPGG
jgi:hypothetical protein